MREHPQHPVCPCGHAPRESVPEVAVKAALRLALSPRLWSTLVAVVTGAPPAW